MFVYSKQSFCVTQHNQKQVLFLLSLLKTFTCVSNRSWARFTVVKIYNGNKTDDAYAGGVLLTLIHVKLCHNCSKGPLGWCFSHHLQKWYCNTSMTIPMKKLIVIPQYLERDSP